MNNLLKKFSMFLLVFVSVSNIFLTNVQAVIADEAIESTSEAIEVLNNDLNCEVYCKVNKKWAVLKKGWGINDMDFDTKNKMIAIFSKYMKNSKEVYKVKKVKNGDKIQNLATFKPDEINMHHFNLIVDSKDNVFVESDSALKGTDYALTIIRPDRTQQLVTFPNTGDYWNIKLYKDSNDFVYIPLSRDYDNDFNKLAIVNAAGEYEIFEFNDIDSRNNMDKTAVDDEGNLYLILDEYKYNGKPFLRIYSKESGYTEYRDIKNDLIDQSILGHLTISTDKKLAYLSAHNAKQIIEIDLETSEVNLIDLPKNLYEKGFHNILNLNIVNGELILMYYNQLYISTGSKKNTRLLRLKDRKEWEVIYSRNGKSFDYFPDNKGNLYLVKYRKKGSIILKFIR